MKTIAEHYNLEPERGVVAENTQLAPKIFKMAIDTNECRFSGSGQYALIELEDEVGAFPVCEFDGRRFTVVIYTEDDFSEKLSALQIGTEIMVLTGMGNGYDIESIPDDTYLVADAAGVAQMFSLTREMLMSGKNCKLILEFPCKDMIFMVDSFRNLCNDIEVLTTDGSNGREGRIEDTVRKAKYVCAGGSPVMLYKLQSNIENGQFNLIELTRKNHDDVLIPVDNGVKDLLSEGPIFDKSEIDWNGISEII